MNHIKFFTILMGCAFLGTGCTTKISLDNPGQYRRVDSSNRIRARCYYRLDPEIESLILEDSGYSVAMGPAVSSQLRTALYGICQGTGKYTNEKDFQSVAADRPTVLFNVSLRAGMDAKYFTWAVNTGSVSGTAVISGADDSDEIIINFQGYGKKRQYYAEVGSGAEGLRRALVAAIQELAEKAVERRDDIHQLISTDVSNPVTE